MAAGQKIALRRILARKLGHTAVDQRAHPPACRQCACAAADEFVLLWSLFTLYVTSTLRSSIANQHDDGGYRNRNWQARGAVQDSLMTAWHDVATPHDS